MSVNSVLYYSILPSPFPNTEQEISTKFEKLWVDEENGRKKQKRKEKQKKESKMENQMKEKGRKEKGGGKGMSVEVREEVEQVMDTSHTFTHYVPSSATSWEDIEEKPPPKLDIPKFEYTVDIKSWESDLRYLASLNRYAKTNTSDVRKAGQWLANKLEGLKGLEVHTEDVTVKDQYESFNVVATLDGTTHPEVWYVIGAHYDSTSENPKDSAPGALDNASGTAAVLEMARIFSEIKFPFTLVFILFTGEEQGFYGSKKYVQNMFIKDTIHHVKMMLNMDMIAMDDFIILETRAEHLAETWEKLAIENSLKYRISYNIWGSDHVTFANAGVPSILTCSDHDRYPHYHKTTDKPDNLDAEAGRRIISMNMAAIIKSMEIDMEYMFG